LSWPSQSRTSRLACAIALAAALAGPAEASKPRLRLERIDAAACNRDGTIDAYVAELELEGTLRQRSPLEYRLVVDGKDLPGRPLRVTTFNATDQQLQLALVIELTPANAQSLQLIRAGARDFVKALPAARTRFTIITYDWEVRRVLALGNQVQAVAALDALEAPRGGEVDLALDEAITLGLRSLGPAGAGPRRLLVVFSDGMNREPKHDVFRGLGTRARQQRVPIHPIGFSAIDERGPLVNLGEVAKRSTGTMRWAQRAEDIGGEFLNLAREIKEQHVLTFPLPEGCERAHVVKVSSSDLKSGQLEIATQGPRPRARSGRTLLIVLFVGGLLVAVTVLVLLARWLGGGRRRAQKADAEHAAPRDDGDDGEVAPRPRRSGALPRADADVEVDEAPRRARRRTGVREEIVEEDEEPARRGRRRSGAVTRATRPAPEEQDEQEEQELTEGHWLVGATPDVRKVKVLLPRGRSVLGAADSCDVRLPAAGGVAEVHAELRLAQGSLSCVDLSGEGILVNGQRVRQATLEDGDFLQIGRVQLVVRVV
jgi:hypothetical protein